MYLRSITNKQLIVSPLFILNLSQTGVRTESTVNPTIGVLDLLNLTPENSGLYVCRATYLDIGTQSSEAALLTVLGFFDELHDVSITQGTDLI